MEIMDAALKSQLHTFKELLAAHEKIVAFTGAGISTESGIPDYRSKDGIWKRFQPITLQEFIADENQRIEYWRRKTEMYAVIRKAQPNAGHQALAAFEDAGKLLGLITQNIDGLHQKAGSKKILELHGTNMETICLDCGKIEHFDKVYERLLAGEEAPRCRGCQGLLKPNTISFGQNLNMGVLEMSAKWARTCDMMICAGSTLIVEPAASLPQTAKTYGAALVIINKEPTPLDGIADLVVHTAIGDFLPHAI